LFLRGGMWGDERIVSAAWVEASTAPVVPDIVPDNGRSDPGYGYQWWVPDHDGGNTQVFAGNGYGGQFLLVAPEYDIVAVFNGWNIHGGARASAWRALQERILPAVAQADPAEPADATEENVQSALTAALIPEMEAVFSETQGMVDHTMEVFGYAMEIQEVEGGDAGTVAASALMHDVGIPRAREVHGSSAGEYQEIEGPPICREILARHSVPQQQVDHVCGIVANHHTAHDPAIVETLEFQILWDADWLVNFPRRYRDASPQEKETAIGEIFRTGKGALLARQMFLE